MKQSSYNLTLMTTTKINNEYQGKNNETKIKCGDFKYFLTPLWRFLELEA